MPNAVENDMEHRCGCAILWRGRCHAVEPRSRVWQHTSLARALRMWCCDRTGLMAALGSEREYDNFL